MQISEVSFKVCFVGLPRQPVHSGCGIAFEREERFPEQIHAEVMEERSELLVLPLPCGLPSGRAPVSREPSPVSGACFALPRSSWSPPLAPPAPPHRRQMSPLLCSSVSPLLWRSVTSHDRASSATAPRLPDADQSKHAIPSGCWSTVRSPGSRTRSVRTCQGLRPRRVFGALAIYRAPPFRLPQRELRRHPR